MCIHVYGYKSLIFCVCISRLIYMLVYVSLHMFKLVRVQLGMCMSSVNCVCAHVKSAVRLHKQSHIWKCFVRCLKHHGETISLSLRCGSWYLIRSEPRLEPHTPGPLSFTCSLVNLKSHETTNGPFWHQQPPKTPFLMQYAYHKSLGVFPVTMSVLRGTMIMCGCVAEAWIVAKTLMSWTH